jgi:hypothetical protein
MHNCDFCSKEVKRHVFCDKICSKAYFNGLRHNASKEEIMRHNVSKEKVAEVSQEPKQKFERGRMVLCKKTWNLGKRGRV